MYKVLNVLEFSSARKRMSVIVRDEDGKLLLLCKGADRYVNMTLETLFSNLIFELVFLSGSVMFERLSGNGREYEEETRDHVNEYADAGLRTLILAYRELDEREYEVFTERISEAKSSVSADREALIDEVTEKIEKDLVLLGATAVEDKLQNGVSCLLHNQNYRLVKFSCLILSLSWLSSRFLIALISLLKQE